MKLQKLWRRDDIRVARDQSTNIDTPYGKVHQTLSVNAAKGREINIEYQNPQSVLHSLAQSSTPLSAMLERACEQHSPSLDAPLGSILHNDVVTLGNHLRQLAPRKLACVLLLGAGPVRDERPLG